MQNQNQNTSVIFPDSNPDEGGASVSYDQNSLNSQALSLDPTQPSSSVPANSSIASAEQAQPKRPGTLVKLAKRADVALAILLILGSIGLVLMSYLREEPVANNSATSRFDTTQLPLEDLISSADGISFGAQSVIINGNLRVNDGLIIAPSLQPTGAVAGQIYYDQTSNMLSYYNGSQFVPVGSGVQSVGGLTGQIAIGGGLSVTSGQITNSGVLSVQGLSGNVVLAAGNGISVSGTTISNDGVVSIVSNTPSLVVADDGNGNVTLTGSGAGTVNSPGGTVGSIPVFTASQTLEDSIITQSGTTITVNGALNVTGGLTLSTPLTVANGGTGANSLALNGVLIGQGTSPITSVVAGAPGLCFVSTAGAPTWGSCTGGSTVTSLNGLTGALTIANATGAGSTITIDDASTTTKGIAQFNSTNFTVGSGVVNTIQNINPAATPTFAGVNTNNITPSAALTVGVSGQTALLQGSTTTITSNGAGNNIVLNSANTIELQDSTNVTGDLSVSGDLAVNGGDVTSTGALNITSGGTLTAGASGQTLTLQGNASTSLRATSGANTTIVGFTNPVANTTLNFPALSAGTYTICTTSGNCAGAGVTLQAAYNNSSSPEIVLDATRGALSIQDNATPLGANLLEVQSNGGGTTYLAVTSAGIAVTGTATVTGNINSSGGALQTGGTTRVDGGGNLTNIGNLTLSGAISGGTTIAGSGNINSTGGAIQTNSTTRIDNSGNLVNIAAITASGNAALQGGTVTLGTSGQAGSVVINDGSSNTGTLQVAPLGQNTVYTLPDPGAGTATICLSTGNCAGTGGGVTTPGGTANRLPVFTGAQTVGNSWLLQNGSTLELDNTRNLSLVGGNLTLQSGNVSVTGTVSVTGDITSNTQVRILESTGATFYANLDVGDLGSDQTFTFLQGGTVVTSGNASTYATTAVTAGGGLTGGGTTGVLTLDIGGGNGIQVNANDIAVVYGSSANTAVQGNTQLTVTAGTNLTGGGTVTLGAGGTLTVNVADSPTFAGNIVAQGGSITVGVSAQAGTLNLYDGGSGVAAHTGTLQVISTLAQNTTFTLPDPGGASATICLSTGNCAGSGGGITGSGTNNRVAKFTGSGSIGDSTITDDGTNVSVSGNITIQGGTVTAGADAQVGTLTLYDGGTGGGANTTSLVAGSSSSNLTFILPTGAGATNQCIKKGSGNQLIWDNCDGGGGGSSATFQTVYNNSSPAAFTLDSTNGGLLIQDNATPIGASLFAVQNNAGSTTYLDVTSAGINVTGAATVSGNINTSGGALQTAGTTRIDVSGNLTNIGTLSLSGAISGGTTITGSGNINTTGGALQTNSTTRVDNSGNLVNIGNITASGSATLQGGIVTLGTSAQAGTLNLYDGGSGVAAHTGTLQVIGTLGQNTTYTLPDPGGASATICLNTGNCASSGGGVTTAGGTTNRLPVFSGAQTIADSWLLQNGSTLELDNTRSLALLGGDLTLQGGNVSVTGTMSATSDITSNTQVRILESTGATFYGILDVGDLAADQTFTFLQGGTVVTNNNIATYATTGVTAGGGLTGGGTTGVLTLDIGAGNGIQVNANDIAVVYGSTANTAVQGNTQITVTAGTNLTGGGTLTLGAGGTLTVNVANSPTFSGNVIAQGGTLTVGASAQAGTLNLYDGGSGVAAHTGTLQVISTLGQNTTYTLPDPGAGTATICLNTGNCASSGGGVTTAGGTTNRLPVFNGAQTLADSWLLQNSSTLELDNTRNLSLLGGNLSVTGSGTFSGDLAVNGGDITSSAALNITPGGALTLGATGQTATLQGSVTTLTSTGAGNDIVLNSADTIELQDNTFITGNLQIQDAAVATKQYRFRTGGSDLDLEASGSKLFVSTWSNADFTGTQRYYLILENGSHIAQAIGSWQFRTTADGTTRHIIDGTTGTNVIFNDNAEATNFTIEGDADANAFFLQGSSDRVGIGTNTPGFKLDVNGTLGVTGNTTLTGDLAVNGGDITSSAALNITPGGLFTLGATGQQFTLQGNASSIITATGGGFTTTVGFTGTPTGAVTFNFDRSEAAGAYTICTTANNCVGTASSLQDAYDVGNTITTTDNRNIVFNLADTATDSSFLVDLQCDTSCSTNGRFAIQDDGVDVFTISPATGIANFKSAANTQAFNIDNASGDNLFTVDSQNSRVGINLGGSTTPTLNGSGLQIQGGLRLSGGGSGSLTDAYTTPGGSNINAKINIVNYDPGDGSNTIIAAGMPTTATSTSSTVISVFDPRSNANHWPSIAVWSPDESKLFGLTWAGSNTEARITTHNAVGATGSVALQSGDSAGSGTASGEVSVRSGNGIGSNNTTGAVTIDSGSPTGTGTAGTVSIGTTNTRAISIGNGSGATSVSVLCGTGNCGFGNNAVAHTTTVGSVTGASTTTLQGGTGGVNVGTGGIANTVQIGNTTGAVTQTINLGNNATASSVTNVTIGSLIGASTTTIQGGTNDINLTTNASTASVIAKSSTNNNEAFKVVNSSNTSLFTVKTNGTLGTDMGVYVLGTGTNGAGGRLFFGSDLLDGVYIGEEGTTNTDRMLLYGDTGFEFGAGDPGNAPILEMSVNGLAVFRPGDSTFGGVQFLEDDGTQTFFADTATNTLQVGNYFPDSTAFTFILDSASGSDPAITTNGAMYFNTDYGQMRCYYDSKWRYCNEPLSLSYGYNISDDFVANFNTVQVGERGWAPDDSNGGALTTRDNIANRNGIIGLDIGTTLNVGHIAIYLNGYGRELAPLSGNEEIEFAVNIPTLADATNDFNVRMGLCDVSDGNDCDDGVYIEYDRDTSANWRYATANTGTRTKTNSSVAVTTGWHRFKFVVNSNASSIQFFLDGTSLGTISTNIPTATSQPQFAITREAGAGTTNRSLEIDYFQMRKSLTTPR